MKKSNTKKSNESYTKVFHFRVMHIGWEMDNDAWIAKSANGEHVCIMQSHGGEYIVDKSALSDLIQEYETVLADSKNALSML